MLSQGELAELLDINQARISRYEKGEEHPTLGVALGLQVVFGRGPRTLFSYTYSMAEEAVMRRAAEFENRLRGRSDFASLKKRQLLQAMMARATKQEEA
jgi:transcriptional regulator with XRE-family HTH domain